MVEILMANKLSPLILHALDLSKAFDRANRDILFHKLNKLGVKGKLWKAILSTYSHSITQILIGALRSKPFQLPNGIKQGSVLSTILFIVLLHDLLIQLRSTNLGPRFNGNNYPASCFVDDLNLLASSTKDFTTLLDKATTYLAVMAVSSTTPRMSPHTTAWPQASPTSSKPRSSPPSPTPTTTSNNLASLFTPPSGTPGGWPTSKTEPSKPQACSFK